ncbi:hypothetical protein FHR70_003764 [Microvirga lupini]|uniref:Uncharacterized protein n=1 Tax=Microvirga lupini TaxID=420324 RepID=A0A7W4YZ47_9HYPH|nr:hypothetical protein [Microvirga lupini]MBB3020678.1 hypothetical protein [Microvirga lupini]
MSVRKGKQACMEAQFWKALRKALYEDMKRAKRVPPSARMEWKAAA